jgi:hypothetical protein
MKRTSPFLLLVVFSATLFLIFSSVHSAASGPRQATVPDLARPSSLAATKSAVAKQEPVREIDPSVWQQIQALLEEKETRTAAQQKIDSQLLYAIKMRRGESIAKGVRTLSVEVGADDAGVVTVDITAAIDDQLLEGLRGMGVEILSAAREYNTLRANVSLEQIETIAKLSQVHFVQPRQDALFSQASPKTPKPADTERYWDFRNRAARVRTALQPVLQPALNAAHTPQSPGGVGSVTSQGDTTHRAFSARGTFNVDGTGIKIGVLSDGVDSLAVSQGTADLGAVTVLPGQEGFGDEGTAMLEIIHDLAPGAQLYFATAVNGMASFAQNIRDLRTAGCDIILDDVGYFVESPFQDGQTSTVVSTNNGGLATQAVNDVVAAGALYFSSAANSGNLNDGTSGTWEGDFADGGTLAITPGGKVHDFDPGAGFSQFDVITGDGILTNLHWSDPLGGSNNDYDLFLLTPDGTFVVGSSTNVQNGTQDPYEAVFFAPQGYRVVILQKTGAANRFLHLDTNRGELTFGTQGSTHGHNAASGAYGVAAVCAVCVFPAPFSASDQVEKFSSDGPRHIFYNGDGSTITPGNVLATGGSVLQKPDITAADGASVSGAGGFPKVFYGTSAAAPHAAAIAALIKSAQPTLTQVQLRTALTATAIDIEAPGTDRDSGAGIVMAYPALQSLGPPVVGKAFLDVGTVTKSETCCNGDNFIDPGESGAINVNLSNVGLQTATAVAATLTTSTPGVTITNGTSTYPNLAASGGSAVNTTPFSFTLAANLSSDPEVAFTLTINYAGGYQASQSFSFKLQLGRELITNGSFETGDFSGWKASTVSTGGTGTPYEPWTVSPPGFGGFDAYQILHTSPQHGTYDAWNSFDGGGPMEFRMYQDISIPSGVSINLSWRDRAQWNYCCGQTQPRTYQVQLRDPATNAVLTTLYSFSTGVVSNYHETGWLTHNHDISAFAGRTVRIYFLETIPEFFTGPGQIEFDSISTSNGPPPTPTPTPTPGPPITQLYGGTRNGQLLTINLSTGAGTMVGNLPSTGSTEIEFNNTTRRAFTQFPDGSFAGQEFDLNTGGALGVAVFDGASFTGLEWVGTSLYGATVQSGRSASDLRILNPTTGASTLIGATGVGNPLSGLAYDETAAVMYGLTGGAGAGGAPSSVLVTVNLNTGVATSIGPVGFNGGSLEFGPDGNLYAGSTGNTGNLYRIDKATGAATLIGPTGFQNITGLALVIAPPVNPNTVQFTAGTLNVTEAATATANLVVTRSGNSTAEATVDYATSDGTATERSDYLATLGTLHFAANEVSKTISVFIVDDRFGETAETFNVTLSNPVGCMVGSPAAVAVNINSDEAVNGANPVVEPSFNTEFFVRQHYSDFLNRAADAPGLAFWKNQIDECLSPECREIRKINVSAAFFLAIEFQQTGYLVYKANQAAYNSHEFLKLRDFLADTQELGRGVVIGQPGAEAQLEANQQKFFLDFVSRPKFRNAAAFPNSMTALQFIDKLLANTYDPRAAVSGSSLTSSERDALISLLSDSPTSLELRARVLRTVSENGLYSSRQSNKAFVLMQYFGYLRRNPPDQPEPTLNYAGYNFWLNKLNQFNGNFVNAELVKAFLVSGEYRQRFGP